MAEYIKGPNFSLDRAGGYDTSLSTDQLLNPMAGVPYYGSLWYVLPVYYNPYLGNDSYAEVLKEATIASSLNNAAYATAMLSQSGIDLGIDYSNYSNFVHFGSATERVSHFYDKLESIEYHLSQSVWIQQNLRAIPTIQSESIHFHINAVQQLFREFDGYDRYLYFATSSASWPKDINGVLYPISTSQATTWLTSQLEIAQGYDTTNENRLVTSLPEYIKDDSESEPALVFCDMLGHHYDNLLLYADAISAKYNADNRLAIGVSRDLVGEALKGLGVKLYQSQFKATDLVRLYQGSIFPTGSEMKITNVITGSNTIPSVKDFIDETHKRIYHNLPYLLQTKGTRRGLRALLNSFGIPSSILEIREFGGVDKQGQNFGDTEYHSTDLGKIRLDNTGSIVSGSTLMQGNSVFKLSEQYTQDTHVIEVGWSTNQVKDDFITANVTSSFDIDDYIGDPRDRFASRYQDLTKFAKRRLNRENPNTLYDFLRLLKYFDNQLFYMIKDFVPARTALRKGAIIKPHLLERSKVAVGQMSHSFHNIESEVGVYVVDGGPSEIWNNHTIAHTASFVNKTGITTEIITDQREKFNGELPGTTIEVTDGELNPNNPLKKSVITSFLYSTRNFTNFSSFQTYPIVPGQAYLYYLSGELEASLEAPEGGGGGGIGAVYVVYFGNRGGAEDVDIVVDDTPNPAITFTNPAPGTLHQVATSNGDTIYVDVACVGASAQIALKSGGTTTTVASGNGGASTTITLNGTTQYVLIKVI